jgi:tRNA threonylcarbamoyl adenosine modification protein (Sua5/YciO/YrdC/YwlC family)
MILRIDAKNPDKRRIDQVVECLQNDGIIIYPTDTVYTLGCSINSKKAYERICAFKKVKPEKANFSIVCSDLSHVSDFTLHLSNQTFRLMKQVLPGPYTFILQANKNVQKIFNTKKKEIGIRVPNHNITKAIVDALGVPILSSSIKHEDKIIEYITDPEDLQWWYERHVDIVIDGGMCGNIPSTIINFVDDEPFVEREGLGDANI